MWIAGAQVWADGMTPEQLAKVQQDEDAAQAKVNAAHGNKDPTDMSADERHQLIEDRQKASQEVFDKNGVTAKDYAHASTHLSREERSQLNSAKADLKAKEAAKATEVGKKPEAGGEPKIEYGMPKDETISGQPAAAAANPRTASGVRAPKRTSSGTNRRRHRQEY